LIALLAHEGVIMNSISGSRIPLYWRLDPLQREDHHDLTRLLRDRSIRKYLCDDLEIAESAVSAIIDGSSKSFDKRGFGLWVIRATDDGAMIGVCGFICEDDVELLYVVHPTYRGRGLAVQASRNAFEVFVKSRESAPVLAKIDRPNTHSIDVALALGMERVGEETNPTTGGPMDVFRIDLSAD
jgi:RimJ/RimL family protein N-acetyltransferase